MASNREGSGSRGPSWAAIIACFCFIPPVGVFLLIGKILANVGATSGDVGAGSYRTYDDRRWQKTADGRWQQAPGVPPKPQRAKKAAKAAQRADGAEGRPGFRISSILKWVGLGLLGVGAVVLMQMLTSGLLTGSAQGILAGLGVLGGFGLSGGGLLFASRFVQKKIERYNQYIILLSQSPVASIDALAAAADVTYRRACRDLQDMVNQGYFPDGFVDRAGRRFICSVKATPLHLRTEAEQAQEREAKAQTEFDAILSQIRAANTLIADERVSEQIDRIETLTRRIFEVVKKQPDKLPQIRTFLNYYLPVTLKLLDAYGQLERQDVDGGNIAEAKNSIERIMETLVSGFEKQLDRLFADAVLDIGSDIRVLETMLAQDGFKSSDFSIPDEEAPAASPQAAAPGAPAWGGSGAAVQSAPEERTI